MEAALGGSSLGWVLVERGLGGGLGTFSYDRAGMGWSDAGPLPRSLPRLVEELRQLLETVQAAPPYILVGHSFGALVMRDFAANYPELTAGLVLVDPPSLEEWDHPDADHQAKLERGILLARRGSLAARLGIARLGAWLIDAGALKLAAACATVVSGGKLRTRSDFNLAPAALLPAELKPALRWFWTRPRFYDALASQMEELPAAVRAVMAAPPLGDVPLVVLSAADTPATQLAEHRGMAEQSKRGRHFQAASSGHWIPLEDPELVIAAIRAVAAATAGVR